MGKEYEVWQELLTLIGQSWARLVAVDNEVFAHGFGRRVAHKKIWRVSLADGSLEASLQFVGIFTDSQYVVRNIRWLPSPGWRLVVAGEREVVGYVHAKPRELQIANLPPSATSQQETLFAWTCFSFENERVRINDALPIVEKACQDHACVVVERPPFAAHYTSHQARLHVTKMEVAAGGSLPTKASLEGVGQGSWILGRWRAPFEDIVATLKFIAPEVAMSTSGTFTLEGVCFPAWLLQRAVLITQLRDAWHASEAHLQLECRDAQQYPSSRPRM